MPIQATPKNFAILATLLAILVVATWITINPRHSAKPVSQTELIELKMNLTYGQSAAVRAQSARQLGALALAGMQQRNSVSLPDVDSTLHAALERESDPAARAAIQSVISQLQDAEIVSGAASPLKQHFK